MNETIAQLAEQAAQESFDTENDTALEVSNDEVSYQIPAGFIQRFAELLVGECIDNVKIWEKDSRNHISYMLKQHFGVEP